MLILGVTVAVMVAAGLVVWPAFRYWSAIQLAPRIDPVSIGNQVHRRPRLAATLNSRLDPTTMTGLALTTGAAVVVAGSVAFGLVLVMVRTHLGFAQYDLGAARFAARHASPVSTTVLRDFTQLGGAVVLVPMALVVWLLSARRHGLVTSAAFLTLTVGGQFAVADLIKWIVDRTRPNVDRLTGFNGPSFPSGHATAAAASFAAFALFAAIRRSARVQATLAALAVAVAAGIACTRVFLGVHWLTDVIGGLLLGWTWFALCSIAFGGRLLRFGAPAVEVQRALDREHHGADGNATPVTSTGRAPRPVWSPDLPGTTSAMSGRGGSLAGRWRQYVRADPREMGRPELAAFLLTGALLSSGAFMAVLALAGPLACLHALQHARWRWLTLAAAGVAISHVGYTFAYREVARVGGGPELGLGDAAVLVTAGFGPFNPRGGFASDASELGRYGLDHGNAASRVLVLATLEYAVLAPAAFGAAWWMLVARQKAQLGLLPSWVIGVPAGGVVTLVIALVRRRKRAAGKGRRVLDRGLGAVRVTLSLLASWPNGMVAWAGMALYWAGEIAALGGSLAVFQRDHVTAGALVVAYATGYSLTRRTLPLAGAGPVEVLLPLALTWVSYPLAEAVLAVVAYRVFNLWLTMLPAGAGLYRLRHTGRRAAVAR